jgi:putative restriction endonuclease
VTAGLEAAHIKWFQAKGPDIEANGLALCALHHKVFDLGAFTILPDTYSLVFSQHAVAGEASRSMLLGFHGAGMIMPQSKDYYPRAEFLQWHEKQVFKRPGRELS